jgi:hypothetical protein
MAMPCSIVFCIGLFLTTAETECTGSTQCASVCWEDIPPMSCGVTPPSGKQFVRGEKPRGVTGPDGLGVQTCPGSLVKVNEEECRALGARDGFTFSRTDDWPQYAPGCFDHGIFQYNTNPTGSAGNPGALWCHVRSTSGEPRHLLLVCAIANVSMIRVRGRGFMCKWMWMCLCLRLRLCDYLLAQLIMIAPWSIVVCGGLFPLLQPRPSVLTALSVQVSVGKIYHPRRVASHHRAASSLCVGEISGE